MYHPPTSQQTYDPNFPPELNITATRHPENGTADEHDQQKNIGLYGIAGKVWDASYPILPYLTADTSLEFDPPCSIFTHPAPVILELGSGQSLASLHLLTQLQQQKGEEGGSDDRAEVYLTDLESVLPLVEDNIARWRRKAHNTSAGFNGDGPSRDGNNGHGPRETCVDVRAHSLPWGDTAAADRLLAATGKENLNITHILMIDLIHFPHLYPLLMKTLLQITQPPFCVTTSSGETTGPEIILSYKSRSLEFEEPFFHTFQRYFQMTPLVSRPRGVRRAKDGGKDQADWSVHGKAEGVYTYICRRWRDTLPGSKDGDGCAGEDCGMEKDVMRRRETWGWEEVQLCAIEWE